MANEKRVFIVTGSEDGNLGVYTNKTLAYNRAIEYLNNGDAGYPVMSEWDKDGKLQVIKATYQAICKSFKRTSTISIWLTENHKDDYLKYGDHVEVEIQEMILNN